MLSKTFFKRAVSGLRHFSKIQSVKAREIIDSRGNPTVEAQVTTENGTFRAAVPSGASTGIYEALELRDQEPSRFLGKGVLKAVENINSTIGKALLGMNPEQQKEIDNKMVHTLDATPNKAKLGANAILAVSLSTARAGAASKGIPLYAHLSEITRGAQLKKYVLPVPSLNIINGGEHAGNQIACQEFMILPTGAKSFKQGIQMGCEVYHNLKKILKNKFGISSANVGDEGGFASPQIKNEEEAIELILEAIKQAGHQGKVNIGLDVAASEFYNAETKIYDLGYKSGATDRRFKAPELEAFYAKLLDKYPIKSIEDPFDQDDFESYIQMEKNLGSKVQIVGDDLLVTNPTRVKEAIEKKLCNALLLKVNQIGSVSESIQASLMSTGSNWGVMVSHRSGETEDTFIADLVVGLSSGQIKSGAPCRSDRVAKYNQLIRIEEELGDKAVYAGEKFRNPESLLS